MQVVKAQNSYNINYSKGVQKGYIILNNGDKIKGELKIRGKLKNQKEIEFREGEYVKQIFYPGEIKAYVFNQTKFVDLGNEFRQILVEGCLNIYQHSYMSFWIGLSSGLPIVIPYRATTNTKKFKDGPIEAIYNVSFRKEWSQMLVDNVEIYQKILSKEYKKRDYMRIAIDYNKSCSD